MNTEKNMKPILITCYVDPDLDGIAGAVAYEEFLKKIGKNVFAAIIGKPHDEAKYVLDRFHITYPKTISDADDFDSVILVDTSDLNGLEGKVAPEKVVEIIDHRKVYEADKFPNAKTQIELVGASATLIAEKFIKNKINISQESATLLFSAIISNTLNFKGSVTTKRDKAAAAWLNNVSKLQDGFWKELFIAKSCLSGKKIQKRIKDDFAWFVMGGKKLVLLKLK